MTDIADYRVLEILVEDERFVLYRANDASDSNVLLKVSRAHASPDDLSALSTDFLVARRCEAPSIPRPIRIDTLRAGGTFQVRQDVPGRPLSTWLEGRTTPRPLGEALEIGLAIVKALEPLHARGFVHCDVNPDKMLYDAAEGAIYFADCANVREQGASIKKARRASDGPYVEPEQALHVPPPVDARTDLYAVGVLLHRLLTGEVPVDGGPELRETEGVPASLFALLKRLLHPIRDQRHPSAAAVRRDLTACLDEWRGLRVPAEQPSSPLEGPSSTVRFPDQVLGREGVRSGLYEAFVNATHGHPALLLLTGDGGSGKSTVLSDFARRARAEGALVLRGGWTAYDRDVPFRGLAPICQQIVDWLSTLAAPERDECVRALKHALGDACGVVTEAFPVLEAALGIHPPPALAGDFERQNRLIYCFTSLLGALGSPEHAVVVLLEDLHWADPSSLLMLQRLPGGGGRRQLLTVASVRTGEDGADDTFVPELASAAADRGQTVRTLFVPPFELAETRAFLATALMAPPAEVEPLATWLGRTSLGNPLALREILAAIAGQGLVVFDAAADRWTWRLEAIQQVHLPENVAQILANRISNRDEGALAALRAAACIGAQFTVADLAELLGRPAADVANAVGTFVDEGFVARVSSRPDVEIFEFRHELVQRAAYTGLAPDAQARLHEARGLSLRAAYEAGGGSQTLFEALTHLNRSHALRGGGESLALAELNLKAAILAKESTAYDTAAHLLSNAEGQLPKDIWSRDPETAFRMALLQAECAYLARRLTAAERLFGDLLARLSNPELKVTTLLTRMRVYSNMGRFEEIIEDGRACLELLGLSFPSRPKRSQVVGALVKVLALHRRLPSKAEPVRLAELDPRTRDQVSCLAEMWGPAFWLDENLTGLVVFELVRLSLTRGQVAASAIGYASYGCFLATAFKRQKLGRDICRLGVRVAEAAGDPTYLARARFMYEAFFGAYDASVRNAPGTYREILSACLRCGDHPYAGAAANMSLYYLPLIDLPLAEVQSEIRDMIGMARHTEQNRVMATVEIFQRWIAILEGRAEHAAPEFSFDLSGKEGKKNENERGLFHLYEIALLYLLEDYDAATAHIDALPGNPMMNAFFGVYYAFLAGLVLAKKNQRSGAGRPWLRAFRRHRRVVDAAARATPKNYRHMSELLAGIEASARGLASEATRRFDLAIASAREDGFLQNAAIAAELAGEHLVRTGETAASARRLREARLWYHQWGCLVKVGALDRRRRERRAERQSSNTSVVREETWPSNAAAVLEAARTLSSETDAGRLVQRLMSSIVEHTRATRGVLLMREDGALAVACETHAPTTASGASDRGDATDLPHTIVNYVDRLGTPVRMVAGADHDLFGRDPYMQRHPRGALLCVPLVNMGQRLGVLFLERDGDGVFAARDLSAAEILASQAAASLTNVREYSERLAALQNQMHPHFLFNALSGIAELSVADPPRAERAILDLSALYRNILVTSRQPAVTLKQELDLAASYLALEKIRFGPRLSFSFEVRGDTAGVLIPPLIVQPIVENSVNHGIALKPGGGLVGVEVTVTDKRVHIRVADTGAGWNAAPSGTGRGAGLGLPAVRRRLELFFGAEAEVTVSTSAGVAVDIFFPAVPDSKQARSS
jgi:predicted ATPase/GAF domain-containing protein